VTGIDLTRDYVDAGNVLSGWLHLEERVSLHQGNALALPFADASFAAAYIAEAARVLRPGRSSRARRADPHGPRGGPRWSAT
jgi:ubiquinone/menaquinone biosynthesis C-methylase UbiE